MNIECPKCNKVNHFTYWDKVTQGLFDFKISSSLNKNEFRYKCPHCFAYILNDDMEKCHA